MAPPNTLRIPEDADPHANAAFMEVMDFLDARFGVIDFTGPDGKGGNYKHRPRHGQISAGFQRSDVAGTITGGAAATTLTNKNETMVRLDRTLFHEYFPVTSRRAGETPQSYAAEVGRQFGIKAGIRVLADVYNASIAAADSVADDHDHEPYVDDTAGSNQVDLSPTVIQAGSYLLADHMQSLDIGVTHSKCWNDLTQGLLTTANTYQVPTIIGELLRDGMFRNVLGKNWIVDDQVPTAAGPTTSSPDKYRTLLYRSKFKNRLGEAPVEVRLKEPLTVHEQHVLGLQSRKEQLQAEFAYNLGIRGKQWDTANGGVNPSDANLALATNWDDSYNDHRQHGNILIVTN